MSTAATTSTTTRSSALDRLVDREEVLQICYWYQGEGFGDTFTAATLEPLLHTPRESIDAALSELADRGQLRRTGAGYCFTEQGRKQAGRLFADSFSDFQGAAHGECEAGCCDGDDHSQCGDDCSQH